MVNWQHSADVLNERLHILTKGSLTLNNLSEAIQNYKSACMDLANLSQQSHDAHEELQNEIHKFHLAKIPEAKEISHRIIVRLHNKVHSFSKLFKDKLDDVNKARKEYEKYLKKFSDALK